MVPVVPRRADEAAADRGVLAGAHRGGDRGGGRRDAAGGHCRDVRRPGPGLRLDVARRAGGRPLPGAAGGGSPAHVMLGGTFACCMYPQKLPWGPQYALHCCLNPVSRTCWAWDSAAHQSSQQTVNIMTGRGKSGRLFGCQPLMSLVAQPIVQSRATIERAPRRGRSCRRLGSSAVAC